MPVLLRHSRHVYSCVPARTHTSMRVLLRHNRHRTGRSRSGASQLQETKQPLSAEQPCTLQPCHALHPGASAVRGASICEHQRKRSRCKECGGASICQHQRIRSECKECGGRESASTSAKGVCKECRGASICPHQRIRSECKECDGAALPPPPSPPPYAPAAWQGSWNRQHENCPLGSPYGCHRRCP